MRHPLLLPIEKIFGRKYVKTTMRMLTILCEAEEWNLQEACLLFASAITKSLLYVRQNENQSLTMNKNLETNLAYYIQNTDNKYLILGLNIYGSSAATLSGLTKK